MKELKDFVFFLVGVILIVAVFRPEVVHKWLVSAISLLIGHSLADNAANGLHRALCIGHVQRGWGMPLLIFHGLSVGSIGCLTGLSAAAPSDAMASLGAWARLGARGTEDRD